MKMANTVGFKGRLNIVHKDKDGNIKQLWNNNRLGELLLRAIRFVLRGRTKLSLTGIKIPFLTGFYGDSMELENLITNDGFAGAASRINGADSEAAFTYLALGTGTTAAAAADSTLETEITDTGLARAAASATRETTTQTDDTARLDKTWTATGAKAITEAGLLNAGAAGVLLGRKVFSVITVANGDSFQVKYDIICATS